MTKRWHWAVWAGFAVTLAGVASFPLFLSFPATRDYGWANLVLLTVGFLLTATGVARTFRQPDMYKGKRIASVFGAITFAVLAMFVVGIFFMASVPRPAGVPGVGEEAPEFSLPDQNGRQVSLKAILSAPPVEGSRDRAKGALLIFYRGYW